ARKQIFLTFAPWTLVTVYGANPAVMASLMLTASFLGVVFRQAFG
ncbi:MAG TPA: MFS transporter, partial [Elusimicrobia bacterium]|nr:MFS transporter [Elusimicrobiota bacterium]